MTWIYDDRCRRLAATHGTGIRSRKIRVAMLAGLLLVVPSCGGGNEKASPKKVESILNAGLQAHVEGRIPGLLT